MNRELFSSLMQKKIEQEGSIADYSRAIENDLKRKQFTLASANLREMKMRYPHQEEYYLLRLEYLASLGRGAEIKELLQEIDEEHIFLTSKAKEVLAFWEN